MSILNVIRKDIVPYQEAWDLQHVLHEKRLKSEIPDTLILLEHPPVYTFGKNAGTSNLLDARDAEVIQSDRGGDITWHGPGQLVAYPIINLENHRKSVKWYMHQLEEVIIQTLYKFDIMSRRIGGLTGVWTDSGKICAMGVRLSRWVTMHGLALNVAPDMSYFKGMIPCGIKDKGVVSMQDILKRDIELTEVVPVFTETFKSVFGYDFINETATETPKTKTPTILMKDIL